MKSVHRWGLDGSVRTRWIGLDWIQSLFVHLGMESFNASSGRQRGLDWLFLHIFLLYAIDNELMR